MRVLINKKDNTKALVLAESEDDRNALDIFYHNHIIFGLYAIWLRTPEGKGEDRPEVKLYLDKLPHLQGIGWLNIVKGFVPTKIIT